MKKFSRIKVFALFKKILFCFSSPSHLCLPLLLWRCLSRDCKTHMSQVYISNKFSTPNVTWFSHLRFCVDMTSVLKREDIIDIQIFVSMFILRRKLPSLAKTCTLLVVFVTPILAYSMTHEIFLLEFYYFYRNRPSFHKRQISIKCKCPCLCFQCK